MSVASQLLNKSATQQANFATIFQRGSSSVAPTNPWGESVVAREGLCIWCAAKMFYCIGPSFIVYNCSFAILHVKEVCLIEIDGMTSTGNCCRTTCVVGRGSTPKVCKRYPRRSIPVSVTAWHLLKRSSRVKRNSTNKPIMKLTSSRPTERKNFCPTNTQICNMISQCLPEQ